MAKKLTEDDVRKSIITKHRLAAVSHFLASGVFVIGATVGTIKAVSDFEYNGLPKPTSQEIYDDNWNSAPSKPPISWSVDGAASGVGGVLSGGLALIFAVLGEGRLARTKKHIKGNLDYNTGNDGSELNQEL